MTQLTYSHPRKTLEVNSWPSGGNRVRAKFNVQHHEWRGERVTRATTNPKTGEWNAPRKTAYASKARIVIGSDGKTYLVMLSGYGPITILQSNLKYEKEVIYMSDSRYPDVMALFTDA